ncbi:hypothetical protein J2X85_004168 [Microbacterium trichothecenolyticum]|uniref:hypothetical protein n=1 Tax=Microbacterium trichothecenolyticum TaxID=69370 RepID=UPI00285C6A30|nr:hypothetical protein [Microbacterium trichothecenolyticum]MDR7187098.1 hypothetical protein [Microbacterium trichothecenolyticum]
MSRRGVIARCSAAAVGGLMIVGMAGAAVADEYGDEEVVVNVEIETLPPVGALTMSVAAESTTLSEVESEDPDVRQFNGTLPKVTVTDDRESVPEGVGWYVTGQSSTFVGVGGGEIGAEHLGWAPRLLTANDGEVAEGPVVDTVLDAPPNNVGLVAEELLALALDSTGARVAGEWEADADLFLKTPKGVAPDSYSATLTLTLWEDAL